MQMEINLLSADFKIILDHPSIHCSHKRPLHVEKRGRREHQSDPKKDVCDQPLLALRWNRTTGQRMWAANRSWKRQVNRFYP